MPDGETLLCANRGTGGHAWERNPWPVTAEMIDRWAESEWIDLRPANMDLWQQRFRCTLSGIAALPNPAEEASSQYDRLMTNPATWQPEPEINIGEVVSWIFNYEEKGRRMKS